MAKDLARMESFAMEGSDSSAATTTTPSTISSNLGVTILASRFAANTRKKIKHVHLPKLPKPEEPDFSAEPDD